MNSKNQNKSKFKSHSKGIGKNINKKSEQKQGRIRYTNRSKFYSELQSEMAGMLEKPWFTNLANASALLMSQIPNLNWVGFYLASESRERSVGGTLKKAKSELLLGPFQGLPACLKIPFGKGVCGTAAQGREIILVDDVAEFPGHIACDSRSQSELVLPLVKGERVLGVLDLDSPNKGRFDERDIAGLVPIVQLLVENSNWPLKFN